MSQPFLAEVKIVGFNFPPRGWAFCDGQILPINQNQSLYSLLGTIYGGDGRTSFALPGLRGRTPIHVSGGHPQGQKSGEETHQLSTGEMPSHDHVLQASTEVGNSPIVQPGAALAASQNPIYAADSNLADMNAASVTTVGSNQSHDNMMPWIALNFCIALTGTFPSRN